MVRLRKVAEKVCVANQVKVGLATWQETAGHAGGFDFIESPC